MAIIVEKEENNSNQNQGDIIRQWLHKIQKSLDFIHQQKAKEVSVADVLQGDAKFKIFDPYFDLGAGRIKDRIAEVTGNRSKNSLSTTTTTRTSDKTRLEREQDEDRELVKLSGSDCIVKLTNGDELQGSWRDGKRVGPGAFYGPRLEKLGIKHISGYYEDGVLTGQGKVYFEDQTIRDGWYQHGYFHGPVRGVTLNGRLDYIGWYSCGLPTGLTWKYVRGDGWLVGCPDSTGDFTGEDIAFIYPDLETALFGKFDKGILVSAKPARVLSTELKNGVLVPTFHFTSEKIYQRWISTSQDIACPPHLSDPYESSLVQVKQSRIEGACEGLYAKVDLPENQIISFYNGLRLEKDECILPETGYDIFLELNLRKDKNAKHLDIPEKYQSSEAYSSTLAHKINHSFEPNCRWDNSEHPVFGLVPCVRTIEPIKAGTELKIHYDMDMEFAPEWYMDEWDRHSYRKRDEE